MRRFLKKRGIDKRKIRVEKAPAGRGAGDAWVLARFPMHLKTYRTRPVRHIVVAVLDADRHALEDRLRQLDEACRDHGEEPRRAGEYVAVILPKRNIETWLFYLGGREIDEETAYPKLERERECQGQVDALDEMCKGEGLRQPAPPSLARSCREYQERIKPAL